MSAIDIVLWTIAGVAIFTIVYALIRLPWRLWRGDVEEVGRDSNLFRRRKNP
jgi:hypothetical protein